MRLVALALVAAALLAPLPILAEPTPICDGTCMIPSNAAGYIPPVVVVTDGSSVQWSSLDIPHANADGVTNDGDACFAVHYGTSPSSLVQFQIDNGVLAATVSGISKTCTHAVESGEGFILPYFCLLHPPMRGTLIVAET